MKLMYIGYGGNFAESYKKLYVLDGKETYYGQKYCVGEKVAQAREGHSVLELILNTINYDVILEKNLRSIGLESCQNGIEHVAKVIDAFAPDRVIINTPEVKILTYLRKKNIETLPVLADSFESKPLYRVKWHLYRWRLSKELKHKHIRWVGNHQIPAAKSLLQLGVPYQKVVAYDWEHSDNPENWEKRIPSNIHNKDICLFYAGSIFKTKGIFDLMKAIPYLIKAGRTVKLTIAGQDKDNALDKLARSLGIESSITKLGLVNNSSVLKHMNEADAVVVPSHHAYPEGLPMTIMESLMTHTPVIASDHPMFVGRVGGRAAVQFFKEKNAKSLAEAILTLCKNSENYKEACVNAPLEWHDLCLDLKWADLVRRWIDDPVGSDFSEHVAHP